MLSDTAGQYRPHPLARDSRYDWIKLRYVWW